MKILKITAAIILIQFTSIAQNSQIKLLDNAVLQINSLNPNCKTNTDLNRICKLIKHKQVVSMGEATHGTKEFMSIRHRLVKQLILNHNFKVFVMENNIASSFRINDSINNSKSEKIDPIFLENSFGIWKNIEFLELLKWIKNYNKTKPRNQKVKIYGCDTQGFRFQTYMLSQILIQNKLIDKATSKKFANIYNLNLRKKISKKTLNKTIQFLLNYKNIKLDKFNNKTTHFRYNLLLEGILQSLTLRKHKGYIQSKKRDDFMATNCLKILNFEKSKMIIWAHNSHIANKHNHTYNKPMGYHLKSKLKNKLYTIGTAFGSGQYKAFNIHKNKNCKCKAVHFNLNCIDYVFSRSQYPNFFLDLNQDIQNKLKPIFSKNKWSRHIGAVHYNKEKYRNYHKHKVYESYDGIIFIRNSTPVEIIPSL